MKTAIIETGGKQYVINPGKILKIEKIKTAQEGEEVVFDKVLLLDDGKEVKIGQPYLADVSIKAQILKSGRSAKIIVYHYHNKTRLRKKQGHRQQFMQIEVKDI
ncbi:MAG: 50S ribosomal protein L21 [Candidatus Parcubacteria bacterium]|nr:50S ribosomal protein L21 [Candidatus Parcubacteria bacterium]